MTTEPRRGAVRALVAVAMAVAGTAGRVGDSPLEFSGDNGSVRPPASAPRDHRRDGRRRAEAGPGRVPGRVEGRGTPTASTPPPPAVPTGT